MQPEPSVMGTFGRDGVFVDIGFVLLSRHNEDKYEAHGKIRGCGG